MNKGIPTAHRPVTPRAIREDNQCYAPALSPLVSLAESTRDERFHCRPYHHDSFIITATNVDPLFGNIIMSLFYG
jgi:hypothetical protein